MSTNGNPQQAATIPSRGWPRAAALSISALLLLGALLLWWAAGAKATRECLESGYGAAIATQSTGDGCTLVVRNQEGRRVVTEPIEARDPGLSAVSLTLAGLAAVPPFLTLYSRRTNE